jgi:hypothetical protein
MSRRTFLTVAGGTGALAALSSFALLAVPFESAAAKLIRKELDFLKLDERGLAQFVSDYAAKAGGEKRLLTHYAVMGLTSSRSGRVRMLVGTYLMSTDFFIHQMDESRTLQYIGLYLPHNRPCANPFSAIYHPQQSA